MAGKTFIKITNQDIYDKLSLACNKLIDVENHVKLTNGTVRWHKKWLYGISTVLVLMLGWYVQAAVN